MKIQIAKSPCYPPYGIIITVNDQELWDCDCASSTLEGAVAAAQEQYPDEEIIMFDDPRHYSNLKD